ncbi:MAG: hypothetical protein ABIH42_11495 [Planctomycetota bacterium]
MRNVPGPESKIYLFPEIIIPTDGDARRKEGVPVPEPIIIISNDDIAVSPKIKNI